MSTVILTAVVGFVAYTLSRDVIATVRDRNGDTRRTLRAIRPWMLPAALGLISAVVAASVLLMQVPGFGTGWWGLLGGEGNVLVGQTGSTSPVLIALGVLVPLLLLFSIPRLARFEEEGFRRGAQRRSPTRSAAIALLFGLAHLIAGIPLGVALALSIAGLGFDLTYRRAYTANVRPLPEPVAGRVAAVMAAHPGSSFRVHDPAAEDAAVDTATALHTVYNLLAVSLLLTVVFAGLL